jgi:hypothetical protein
MSGETSSDVGVVRLIKAYEPRLDIRADREFVAMMGPSNISTRRYQADTKSNSQVVWSQTTPSVRIGVDRTIEVDITFRVEHALTVTAPPPPYVGGPPILNNNLHSVTDFGPRAYPLHSITEVMSLRLNDQQFTWEPSETVHGLLTYGNTWQDRQYNMGASAHYPDQVWRYDNVVGAARSPFNSYLQCQSEDSRNIGFWATRINDTTFTIRCVEQIMLSPLTWADEVQCLFGIQNIDFAMTFKQPLERLFSGDQFGSLFTTSAVVPPVQYPFQAGDLVNATYTIQDASLHVTYLQPQASQIIPARLNYPYYQVRKFTKNIDGTVEANVNFPNKTIYNNITLHEIPKRLLLMASPVLPIVGSGAFNGVRVTDAYHHVDHFAAIETVTLNFDTQDGRLSTLDSYDLWKIACKNGYKRSWLSWSKYMGSVLALEFGTDLNLNPLLAPGVRGNYQLSLEVQYRDIRNQDSLNNPGDVSQLEPYTYKAYLIIIPTGIMTIENQLITVSIGSITEQQVYDAPWAEAGLRHEVRNMYGAGSFSNIWKAVKKVGKTAAPVAQGVADVLGDVFSASSDPRYQKAAMASKIASKAISKARGGAQVRAHSLSRRM